MQDRADDLTPDSFGRFPTPVVSNQSGRAPERIRRRQSPRPNAVGGCQSADAGRSGTRVRVRSGRHQ